MKKIVRLTESDLHGIIKECVNKILKEDDGSYNGIYIPGNLSYEMCVGKINSALKRGYSREEIQDMLDEWSSSMKDI